jgi:hypothetical protein
MQPGRSQLLSRPIRALATPYHTPSLSPTKLNERGILAGIARARKFNIFGYHRAILRARASTAPELDWHPLLSEPSPKGDGPPGLLCREIILRIMDPRPVPLNAGERCEDVRKARTSVKRRA